MSERLAAVEALLCARYNVRSLDGPLKDAIDADDLEGLRVLLGQRELYQWRGPLFEALEAAENSSPAEAAAEQEFVEGVVTPRRRSRATAEPAAAEPEEAAAEQDPAAPVE